MATARLRPDAVAAAPYRLCIICIYAIFFCSLFLQSYASITYDFEALHKIATSTLYLHPGILCESSSWPREILRDSNTNNGYKSSQPRRWKKKHRGKRAGVRNKLRTRAHRPPLPSILLANVQSLDNKLDDIRARVRYQRDVRDCNILCFTETWLSPAVPDHAVLPRSMLSVFRQDRTEESGKSKGGGVCFMTNNNWCDPMNVSILSRSCSPDLEHLAILCRPFYLPPSPSQPIFHLKLTLPWLCHHYMIRSTGTFQFIQTLH